MRLLNTFVILIMVGLIGCAAEQHDWSDFGVYEKAIDVDNYAFPNGSANQVFYKVKAEYPNKDVLSFYKKRISAPWVECSEGSSWESFGDISGNEPLYIHQLLQRWVNKDKNRLLLLAIKYRSPGGESRDKPENNIQNVYLVEYKEPNIDETIKTLGIKCNGI